MEAHQLKELIKNGENQEVEFKQAWPSQETIGRVICSLANTSGGVLLVGVSDDGKVAGIEKKNLDKLQKIIAEANHSISPIPIISVDTHTIYGKEVVMVAVQRAKDNTYYTFQGAIFIRMGSTTHRLEGQTQLDYLRHRQILSFDETIDETATIEDIDKHKVEDYLKARGQQNYFRDHTLEDFLVSNKLALNEHKKLSIKNATLVLFGKNPTLFHPQIEVKLVQFAGEEPVDILDYRLIQTDLVSTIKQSIDFLQSKLAKRVKIESARRTEEYEYPISVIREAVVNAITHRDYFSKDSIQISLYANRLEITSPGSLPSELTKELFGTISIQRNPIIYRILRDLGYVEGLGTGIPRIKSESKKAGLPHPDFKFTPNFIRVILFNGKEEKPKEQFSEKALADFNLNFRQEKALDYLKSHKMLKAKNYATMNKVSYATAVNEINHLINLGLLKKIGEFRGAYYILNKKPQ